MYKNILIVEAYTDANIGSGSLVENSIKLLRQKYPNSNIRVMAHFPESFVRLCRVDAIPDFFFYPFGQSQIKQVFWLVRTVFWMAVIYAQSHLLGPSKFLFFKSKIEAFLWADLIVSVGAERINDKFVKNIIFSLYTYLLVKKLNRPMVLFPCTIGPFLFSWTKSLTARVLKQVDLIYTRDDRSYTTVCKDLEIDPVRVVNTSDVAVVQEQISCSAARKMMEIQESEKIVGISAMHWTYVANSIQTEFGNYKAYVREMARLADEIIEAYKVTIVFYPTNFPVNGCREDDVGPSKEIIGKMRHQEHTRLIDFLPEPSQLKGMLSCSEINITTRMHACIFSTGALVPTISINYLFKLKEYMTALGLADFSIDIERFSARWGKRAFDTIWRDRETWRTILSESIDKKQRGLAISLDALDRVPNNQYPL